MISLMGKESKFLQTVQPMKVNLSMAISVAKVYSSGLMVPSMMEIGKTINSKV